MGDSCAYSLTICVFFVGSPAIIVTASGFSFSCFRLFSGFGIVFVSFRAVMMTIQCLGFVLFLWEPSASS